MSDQIVSDVQGVPSQVNNGRKPISGLQKIGIFVLVGAFVFAFILLRGSGNHQPVTVDKPLQTPAIEDSGADFKAPPVTPPLPATTAPTPPLQLPLVNSGMSFGRSQPNPEQIARNSDILGGANSAAPPAAGEGSPSTMLGSEPGSDASPLGQALKPTRLQGSKATLLPHPDMTITMGTPFPCIPQEPLTSDAPGMVTCIVPVDIRGTTGRVILLDRGTKIVGTVQAALQQGHSRMFVLWQRAETPNPNHVVINLDSPAADELGEAGLEGDINTHFWQRFGGAIMLSFIDSGLQAAAALASHTGGGEGSVSFSSFSSGGSNAASAALANTINIPPTMHRDQALPATVFVARDLDFSDVYGLQVAR